MLRLGALAPEEGDEVAMPGCVASGEQLEIEQGDWLMKKRWELMLSLCEVASRLM